MKLFVFATPLIIALLIALAIKKSDYKKEQDAEEFFEKERKSNFVKKKPLDSLNYVKVPDKFYEYSYSKLIKANEHPEAIEKAVDQLMKLKDAKMVNFLGKTNTDLKLEYGTGNLEILMEYDQNFTSLITCLEEIGEAALTVDKAYAKEVLEFSINIGSDISSTYKNLLNIYIEESSDDMLAAKKEKLIFMAKALNSPMGPSIVRYIEQAGVENEA
ncbi:MAG TPA: hypothetical protein DCP07_02080 [Lachnospiraceae bacterium]|nr:hypothetical protein [Lachnospiraceae bacterium]